MSREAAERAVAAGIALLEDERRSDGVDIVGCGEMGIGNTTSAAALIAAVTGRPPAAVTGRGTGADDTTYARKVRAVERALEVNAPDPADGIGLLAALGGYEIGVLAGVYLAGGEHARARGDGRRDLRRGVADRRCDRAARRRLRHRLAPLRRAGATS